ncbi:MAG: hypothetical protein ACFFES_15000 [Candidatus Thorarchaeota archaeon]
MEEKKITYSSWTRLAGISGLAGILCYFGAAFIPLPDVVGRLLAFSFGPALVISFLGTYRVMSVNRDSIVIQIMFLFGVIAGTLVTSMLVVQVGNNMTRAALLTGAETEAARESIKVAWGAVNRVQYLLDVVWDIFITVALILLGVSMINHPRFGKIWGYSGILISFALLVLNLYTFPEAPADAGSVDLGPLAALWMLAVYVRILFLRNTSADVT